MYYGRIPPHLYTPRVDTVNISKEARQKLEEQEPKDGVVHVEIGHHEEHISFDYFLLFVMMSGSFSIGFIFGTILAYI